MVESESFYLLFYRSENRQSLGELFVGFFKYYAVDFRYAFHLQHIACMRYMVNGSFGFDIKLVHVTLFADGTLTIYQLQGVLPIHDILDNGKESPLL